VSFIVGIGGTLRPGSSSEQALAISLRAAADSGAQTAVLSGRALDFPFYDPGVTERSEKAAAFLAALRKADGVIISSPGYHGAMSGLIKNALDYIEDLAGDPRVYLSDVPVGCIGVAYGNQAAVAALSSLRSTVHALRGFPTPYGAAVVAGPGVFTESGCADPGTVSSLELVGQQVLALCRNQPSSAATTTRKEADR